MTAVFLNPKAFTVVTANQSATALAANLRQDEAGMVWRSSNLTTVYVTVQLDGTAWDSVALVGSNLRASDTIRIRAGATAAIVDGSSSLTVDQTFAAWSGTAPTNGALSFKLLGAAVTSPFVRIDITSTGNSAGYVQAKRLVIGKRVETDGVNIGAEQTFEDMSSVEEGLGYTTVDRYGVRIGWKVTLDGIKDATYNNDWYPFLRDVGRSKPFVFIPDDSSAYVQTQAVFGRVNSTAKGSSPASDFNVVEINLLSTY
ncbi:hypothetical protein [Sphingomonas sp. Leaf242]|uniref:hypothetical protein n=1 Tax=Sphingomonas sp. Leaf242 TaxID=1736304 RepID=UPI0007142775|nr:hypothetical protein [Sphingomonas sp. Leaf242]KQO09442.1 hypothetical protein ASF09_07400 [Sphingomonas sp. Leaf242]